MARGAKTGDNILLLTFCFHQGASELSGKSRLAVNKDSGLLEIATACSIIW